MRGSTSASPWTFLTYSGGSRLADHSCPFPQNCVSARHSAWNLREPGKPIPPSHQHFLPHHHPSCSPMFTNRRQLPWEQFKLVNLWVKQTYSYCGGVHAPPCCNASILWNWELTRRGFTQENHFMLQATTLSKDELLVTTHSHVQVRQGFVKNQTKPLFLMYLLQNTKILTENIKHY